jgi:hypothetical protein
VVGDSSSADMAVVDAEDAMDARGDQIVVCRVFLWLVLRYLLFGMVE